MSAESALALAPVILFAPLLSFIVLMTAGRWPAHLRERAHCFAIPGIVISLGASLYAFAAVALGGAHAAVERSFAWVPTGDFVLRMGFRLDGLAAIMLLVVTIVATGVQFYSIGYMHGDPRYWRFFAYLSLFSCAMLGLVLANNLLQLYIFWELVGLCSYLLIGFWFERPEAMRAAKKAFLVTRLGDIGFLLGLLILFRHAGTFEYAQLFQRLPEIAAATPMVLTAAALLLFCGAIGKSAQFPLHVWLPDAMEGPTPVSALIHAATMVAAGVYLVGRMYPLFQAATEPWAPSVLGMTLFQATPLQFVAAIGAITAVLGATIGVLQSDIKRVLAFSTISQLGYMMIGLGVGGFFAGLFHLVTHAFFKALLFLGAGSVIHGTGTQDLFEMGGLRKKMPQTFWTFLIGSLSLAGFPLLFSGFWSKEEILLGAFHVSTPIFVAGILGAVLTAFYMTRLVVLAFFGEPRNPEIHAHESPLNMCLPLWVLAVLSIGWWKFVMLPLHHLIDPGHFSAEVEHAGIVQILGIGAGLLGILAGYLVYYRQSPDPRRALIALPLVGERLVPGATGWLGRAPGVYTLVKNKYFLDELYASVVIAPLFVVSRWAHRFDVKVVDHFVNAVGHVTLLTAILQGKFDKQVVDGAVNGAGWTAGQVGQGFRRLQTGLVQGYALIVFVGLVAATGLYLYFGFR